MPTPISSSTSYASPTQFAARYDVRKLGDLAQDLGSRVSSSGVLSDTNVQEALNDASGEIEAACYVSSRYTPTDLAALTGMSLKSLVRLTCDLAYWFLLLRRFPDIQESNMPAFAKNAFAKLEMLEQGKRIFGLQEVAEAGIVDLEVEEPADVEARYMITEQAERFFGRRSNRMTRLRATDE